MSNLQSKGKTAVEAQPPPAEIEIPDQSDFYKLPARFGALPLDEAPLGYVLETKRRETKVTKFEHAYPRIYLPFQEVKRESFGHGKKFEPTSLFPIGANRLFFGNNLHVMRQLPSRSIDLIYIDPPFFSGRVYNQIFGDKNEIRSFSDIWEGGMPGYLVGFNARLWKMKRLLKDTGSIYVHLDYHASHYVKVEMDKIFGNDNFLNEIIWCYKERGISKTSFNRKHDAILLYAKQKGKHVFNSNEIKEEYSEVTIRKFKHTDQDGRHFRIRGRNVPEAGVLRRKTDIPIELESEYTYRQYLDESEGSLPRDWFE